MKVEIEKETLKRVACILQALSTLGAGMKITREIETAANDALGTIDTECPDLDL